MQFNKTATFQQSNRVTMSMLILCILQTLNWTHVQCHSFHWCGNTDASADLIVTGGQDKIILIHSMEEGIQGMWYCDCALYLTSYPGLSLFFNVCKKNWGAWSILWCSVITYLPPLMSARLYRNGGRSICNHYITKWTRPSQLKNTGYGATLCLLALQCNNPCLK